MLGRSAPHHRSPRRTALSTSVLTLQQVQSLLETAAVPHVRTISVQDPRDLADAFVELETERVVLKAGGLLHKTDEGGVVLGLNSVEELQRAARDLDVRLGVQALPFLVQPQVEGVELLVGLRREPGLGCAIVVGAGGVLTEIHADITERLVPVGAAVAREMLEELRSWPLLNGFRGAPPCDVGALIEVIVAISELAERQQEIVELDLNPVMVGAEGEGCRVVDARAIADDAVMPSVRDRLDLDRMLRPEHVVVVGVSDDEHKVGARLFRYLVEHDFAGRLDAIHPSGGSVQGRARLAELRDVDGSPDLVLVAVPAAQVPEVARQAVEVGAGGVLVHSSGFAETGTEGRSLQDDVARILSEAGIPLAGPNNMGIVVPSRRLAASISGGLELTGLVPGRVALMTCSGALGSCVATRLMAAGVGLSHWIHAGNEADRVVADYLEWLVDDEATGAVGLIVEDIKDASRFIAAGRALSAAGKPVFAYNMVRSEKGRAAALSHTGALVGSLRIRQHVLASARMTEVPTLRVLEDVMLLGAADRLPRGPRLAVVTFSGGASTVIADELDRWGIVLDDLSPETAAAVQAKLPSFAAVHNPLDVSYQVISQPEAFRDAMTVLLTDGAYDAALVQFTTNADPYAEHTAKAALAVREAVDVPVYLSRYGADAIAPRAVEVYREAGVSVLDAPDRAAQAVAALLRAQNILSAR